MSAHAADMVLPILGGVDGDTIKTQLPLPCPLCRAMVRIRGIDTPEKPPRSKCMREAALAHRASELTSRLTQNAQVMEVRDVKWDKYGGRLDGYVFVNGVNVGQKLIDQGLAVPYEGKKKQSWCR